MNPPTGNPATESRHHLLAVGVALLLSVLVVELVVPARRQSQTFDEGYHIVAGYSYWKSADFGVNPEHPPLVKLLTTLPLLPMQLRNPPLPGGFFKLAGFRAGRALLYSNDADAILFRARMAAAILTILAALLIFAAAYEMFGAIPALFSLMLFVFEPNLIAHGALVTTDMGITLFLFATVYAFYRYVKQPSAACLLVVCVAAGLSLATKHSGILWAPILSLLAFSEVVRNKADSGLAQAGRAKHLLRLSASLAVVGVVSVVILWSFYGFRFQARPPGLDMVPTLHEYVQQLGSPAAEKVLSTVARYHLLPEAYIYGFADVLLAGRYNSAYLFGKVYPHSQWFYFPVAFVIKSTLGFLLLLLLFPVSIAVRGVDRWREILYLTVPPAVYFVFAMRSGFNLGIRHLLPVFPLFLIAAGSAAWRLARSSRIWVAVVAALLLFHAISSVRAFPEYLSYSNEAWGGPANTYKALSDSNVDWIQQLKVTKKYLNERSIKDCWFDYLGRTAADPDYYGIPCKPLPDGVESFAGTPGAIGIVPRQVEGAVLISATELSGMIWGPPELNPYAQLQKRQPDDLIANGVLVFRGRSDLPLAAAVSHTLIAQQLLEEGKFKEALAEAQAAVLLAPNDVGSQVALGDALARANRKDEARAAYQRAISLAQTVCPEFQGFWVGIVKEKMSK